MTAPTAKEPACNCGGIVGPHEPDAYCPRKGYENAPELRAGRPEGPSEEAPVMSKSVLARLERQIPEVGVLRREVADLRAKLAETEKRAEILEMTQLPQGWTAAPKLKWEALERDLSAALRALAEAEKWEAKDREELVQISMKVAVAGGVGVTVLAQVEALILALAECERERDELRQRHAEAKAIIQRMTDSTIRLDDERKEEREKREKLVRLAAEEPDNLRFAQRVRAALAPFQPTEEPAEPSK